MGGNPPEGLGDDFFEQILAVPPAAYDRSERYRGGGDGVGSMPMALQLGSGDGLGLMPLGLNLEQQFLTHHHHEDGNNNISTNTSASSITSSGVHERDPVVVHNMPCLFPAFGHLQARSMRPTLTPPLRATAPQIFQPFLSQPTSGAINAAPHPPVIRPRVRARRGQATDPHSIAERLRRERIAERMKALQELVPSANKTDRAAMLDEIVDYVKFLRIQVKVLSMSRLGGTGAVAQLVADVPLSSVEAEGNDSGTNQQPWDKWSTDGTEHQVAKLMEEDVGAALQFLQSKALCIMPISLATAIFQTYQPADATTLVKPETNCPS